MSKSISDLRNAMFETIQALKEGKITVEQAKAMSDIGQVIINSAKVEVDYIRANNGGPSASIDTNDDGNLQPGVTRITRHRLVG